MSAEKVRANKKSYAFQETSQEGVEFSRDGKSTVYPAPIETRGKGKLKLTLKKLIHIRKGH